MRVRYEYAVEEDKGQKISVERVREEGISMKKKTWREIQLSYMEWFFKKDAERWESMKDDRRVFHNMYNLIIEAIMSLPEEPSNYVCVAMNNELNKDKEVMKKIQKHFEGR